MGLAVGLSRMVLEFAYPVPRCGILDPRPSLVRDLHYLHFALLLCLLTAVSVVGISWLTLPPPEAQVSAGRLDGRAPGRAWGARKPGATTEVPLFKLGFWGPGGTETAAEHLGAGRRIRGYA